MDIMNRIERGELFLDNCQGLPKDRLLAKDRMVEMNKTRPGETGLRYGLLKEILGTQKKVHIEPPFYFCYGRNIDFGDGCYVNFSCNFLDDGKITIGEDVIFGSSVTIITVDHPVNPNYRKFMFANPVIVEDNCYIGTNVTICPGVTIGKNSVIRPGSVVTEDIPENSVASGNPCKVLREINQDDMTFYNKDKLFDEADIKELRRINGL